MDEANKEKVEKKNDVIVVVTIGIISIIFILLSCYYIYIQKVNSNIHFALNGDTNVQIEVGNEYVENGVIAQINHKNVANKIKTTTNLDVSKVGNYKIEYHLQNPFLNINKTITRNINVKDTIAPNLTVNSKKKETVYLEDKYKIPTCKAIDNYDGDITANVKIVSNVDTSKVGTYKIQYSVADSSGNKATEEITVKVKKKKNPYIVVSISNQTLKYYEYDRLVLSSNVVTGINGKTPTGTFKVLNKATDIILKGKDYESFVSYWIAFCGASFGFHDASWRSNFGGNIYKYNGSHGCVNMPYNKVRQLYNIVPIGTPVYIRK